MLPTSESAPPAMKKAKRRSWKMVVRCLFFHLKFEQLIFYAQAVLPIIVISFFAWFVWSFAVQRRLYSQQLLKEDKSVDHSQSNHHPKHRSLPDHEDTRGDAIHPDSRRNGSKPRPGRRRTKNAYHVDEHEPLPFEQLDAAACTPQGQMSLRERLDIEENLLRVQREKVSHSRLVLLPNT
jgi:ABC-type nickel/cobalt efflux system permease component RcnA